jgi:hypothetical protein
MIPGLILGEIQFSPETREIGGWCWAPDRPDERLIVDILADDTVIASMVAGQPDSRLLNSGIGDGLHAFSTRLPDSVEDYQCISVRERGTGHEVARITAGEMGGFDPFAARIQHLADTVGDADDIVRGLEEAAEGTDIRASLHRFGWRLRARARLAGPATPAAIDRAAARRMLRDRGSRLQVPAVSRPDVSLLLTPLSAGRAMDMIAGLAPALAGLRAEIVVVDTGADPLTSLLPASVRHLRYVSTQGDDPDTLAAETARGRLLVFLDDTGTPPSAAALLDACAAAGDDTVLAGRRCEELLQRYGGVAPDTYARHALSGVLGLRLALSRTLLTALGPVDPILAAVAGLPAADLVLKADLLSMRVVVVAEPVRPTVAAQPRQAAEPLLVAQAVLAFRERWGAAVAN